MAGAYVTSLVRTGSALLAGWLLSLPLAGPVLTLLGQDSTDPATKEKIVAGLTAVLSAGYYAAAHAAERRWPQLTVLLGSTKQPVAFAPAVADWMRPGTGTLQPGALTGDPAPASSARHAALTADPGQPDPDQPDPFMEGG